MPDPLISVIMASRNGMDTLPPVFDALANCEQPPGGVEFLLIDNGSDDGTQTAMEAFAEGRDAQVIVERRHGKSFALNTAIDRSKGELLVFIDDDALPVPGWLHAFRDAATRNPEAGILIGQVRPKFLAPAPAWIEQLTDLGMSFACTPLGQAEGPCSPRLAKGLNWALRRSAIGEERFDEGRNNLLRGGKPTGGQDTEMARRLHRLGSGVIFAPAALCHHQIQPDEMTAKAIFERYRRIGRGVAAQAPRGWLGNLSLPLEIAVLAVLTGLGFAVGAQRFGGTSLTRLASRLGRLEYLRESPRR
jgi:GT2 family glycosyltransferase